MSSSSPFSNSLRFKLWMRRLSISAPRMTIKSQMPWMLRIALIVIVIGLGGAMAMWAYDLGRSLTGLNPGSTKEQVSALKEEVEKLRDERDRFSTTVNAGDSQLNIER